MTTGLPAARCAAGDGVTIRAHGCDLRDYAAMDKHAKVGRPPREKKVVLPGLTVTRDLRDRFTALAATNDITKSEAMRRALEVYLSDARPLGTTTFSPNEVDEIKAVVLEVLTGPRFAGALIAELVRQLPDALPSLLAAAAPPVDAVDDPQPDQEVLATAS